MKVDRVSFWFKDGDQLLVQLNDRFYGLSVLLSRLLNEAYNGKRIKFINIDFSTIKTYELHSNLPKGESYYFGGHLRFYGVIDIDEFNLLSRPDQEKNIWERAYSAIKKSAESIKNENLTKAIEEVYARGLDVGLNPDYRMIESDIWIEENKYKASVWVHFREDGMYSRLTLEFGNAIIFEKDIDSTKNGVEFFLEIYNTIEIKDGYLVISGHKDVEYLPLSISLNEIFA